MMNTTVEMENNHLVIKIPEDFVYATIVYGQDSTVVDPSDASNFPDASVMEDFEEFLPDLLSELRAEDETGWSLINDLVCKAAENAMEQGALGVKYPED